MSMTGEEVAAERERFVLAHKERHGWELDANGLPNWPSFETKKYDFWLVRAEIAHAEQAELVAERDRLRERVRELAKDRLQNIISHDADSSFPYGSSGLWSVACDERSGAWLMQLAEEAGVWFDDNGNEVPLDNWKARVRT